jgi:hypothetical protein
MLPDIDTPNKRFSVSGLGAYEGHGILSRSAEDLHPDPERYEVVWSGSIDAQIQKAEQRQPSKEETQAARTASRTDRVFKAVLAANRPVTAAEAHELSGIQRRDLVENCLRRLAREGQLSTWTQRVEIARFGRFKYTRMFAAPLIRN